MATEELMSRVERILGARAHTGRTGTGRRSQSPKRKTSYKKKPSSHKKTSRKKKPSSRKKGKGLTGGRGRRPKRLYHRYRKGGSFWDGFRTGFKKVWDPASELIGILPGGAPVKAGYNLIKKLGFGTSGGSRSRSASPVKKRSSAAAKSAAKHNPWVQHVKAYQAEHPGMKYGDAMKAARSSYSKMK